MVLSRIFGTQAVRLQPVKWDCPAESLGALVGPLHGGRYQCWEAAGKARQVFTKLRIEIKEYLEATTISTCDIISWSMYMIGPTPDKAAPKVLICSTNSKVRKSIRKSLEHSGIMKNYPGVGLGDTSTLPDRHVIRLLSREAIEALIHGNCEPEFAVLVEKERPQSQNLLASDMIAVGRRAFVINPVDYSLQPITTGPAIEADGRIYRLTAAHGFVTGSNSGKIEEQVLEELDDCDFDGMSDGEDDIDQHTLELESEKSSTSKISAMINPFSQSGPSKVRRDPLGDTEEPCEIDVSNLEFYGTLALNSATGNRPTLDYALIEQKNILRLEAQIGLYTIGLWDRETIGPEDANVIAILGESVQVEGELTATPTYICLPGWLQFQEVYPVRLKNYQFSVGDSGAGVYKSYGQGLFGGFFGHIVAGGPGTNIAYIVPAMQTLADIQVRLGQKPPLITFNDIKQIAQDGLFYSMLVGLTIISGLGLYVILEHYLKASNGEERSWSESMKFYFKFVLPMALVMTFGFMVGWYCIFLPRELERRFRARSNR
jgi:hypothetical protein